jgi:ADP-ribosylglycohydrolase
VISREERMEGALLGLLVGDALGVPYEFSSPERLPAVEAIEMTPPQGFVRAHAGIAAGTWSDDGAQALCLLASLLDRGRLDVDDLGRRLVSWYRDGTMAVEGVVFDIGIQTEAAIHRLMDGKPAAAAGSSDEFANGNGSLMRVAPLALWHRGEDVELVEDAHAQSVVTHGHPRAQVCCALYCLWLRRLLGGAEDPRRHAVTALRRIYGASRFGEELESEVRPDDPIVGGGTGYVVDTLRSARDVIAETTYERVVRAAIALGNDTDTTACVAGALAGAREGTRGIPTRWLDQLRGRELVEPLLRRLLGRS